MNKIEQYQDVSLISLVLEKEELFQVVEFKVLSEQRGQGFLSCYQSYYNGRIKLIYDISEGMLLTSLLKRGMKEEDFLKIIYEVISIVIKCEEIGYLQPDHISLKFQHILVGDDNRINVLYQPFNMVKEVTSITTLKNEIKEAANQYFLSYEKIGLLHKLLQKEYVTAQHILFFLKEELHLDVYQLNVLESKKGYINNILPITLACTNLKNQMSITIHDTQFVLGKGTIANGWDLRFNSAISKKHAKIMWMEHAYYIEDLGSTNGTYLNRIRINKGEKVALKKGDIIFLADTKIIVS